MLDDIEPGPRHGELIGGFKVSRVPGGEPGKLGLVPFGADGRAVRPDVHEALMHSYSPDVTEPTCVEILQPGYRVGERVLRPARVAVAEPQRALDASRSPQQPPRRRRLTRHLPT